jgi:hypothetical protein
LPAARIRSDAGTGDLGACVAVDRKPQFSPAPDAIHEDGSNGGVVQDNFLLGVAVPDASISDQVLNNQNGVCIISQRRSGHGASTSTVLDIPFAELGEFVYHCHILEHEDGGMMAKIQVVPSLY